jgi:nicotinic acid mononucleotide adenylyltransferase
MAAPDIVNSYQGAFGPPTLGHYEAMLFAARKTIEMNPGKEILMLYMPTAESSSKPHLKLTQEERIAALTEFCTKLKNEIAYDKINFEASRIEYEIYKEKKSSATIHTLRALKSIYPSSTIIMTMGLDNLFDLPFWGDVETYSLYTKDIYVLSRDISPEDEHKLLTIPINGQELKFHKFASWDARMKSDVSHISYDESELKQKLEKVWSAPNTGENGELNTLLEIFNTINFKILEGKPSPTSSSLLRVALKKYYVDPSEDKYLDAVRTLIGHTPVLRSASEEEKSEDPWFVATMKSHHLEKQAKLNSFNTEFRTTFKSVKLGGKRRKTRRTNKSRSKRKHRK